MRANDLKELLNSEPFQALKLGLSGGRAVIIRHPDQVVVTERNVFVGVARME